jgi:hypothetical protein
VTVERWDRIDVPIAGMGAGNEAMVFEGIEGAEDGADGHPQPPGQIVDRGGHRAAGPPRQPDIDRERIGANGGAVLFQHRIQVCEW